MKKQLLLSVLSLFALVACGEKTSEPSQSSSSESSSTAGETSSSASSNSEEETSSSKETSSNSTSSSENSSSVASSNSSVETKDWTKEQKELMQDHLYGEVLPYIDLGEGATIQYVDWVGEFQILGSESTLVTADTLQAYAALYTVENGWKDDRESYPGIIPESNYYVFEKEIAEVEDTVVVQFYAEDVKTQGPSADGNGSFVLAAVGDPLFSDFPSDVLNAQTKYMGSNVTIPAFPADAYLVPDPDYVDFYCFTQDSNAEDTYKDILEKAQFTVVPQTDDYGGTYYAAISSDQKYAVGYSYVADYQALEIFLLSLQSN